jgi:hypothetical protein
MKLRGKIENFPVAGRDVLRLMREIETCGEYVFHRNEANSLSVVDRSPERKRHAKSSTWTKK